MAQRDLVVSFLSAMRPEVSGMFMHRPLELVCPVGQAATEKYPGGRQGYQMWLSQFKDGEGNVIPGMFERAGLGSGDTMGRVLVMGFSNGCIGVDETLRANDSVKIDCVLAVDGIHGAYKGGSGELNQGSYKRFLNHGVHVLRRNPDYNESAPVMIVTHSSIVPPGFPSTTETADFIWQKVWSKRQGDVLTAQCGFDCAPAVHESRLSQVMTPKKIGKYVWQGFADGWYDRRIGNNFAVWGWGDLESGKITTRDPAGTADHIFQGQYVLHELIKEFAVRRWNADCGVVVATSAMMGDGIACRAGQGLVYAQAGGEQKVDYFPEISDQGGGAAVPNCPPPPPGHVIVGGPDGPCTTAPAGGGGGMTITPPLPVAQPESHGLRNALVFGGAALAGYACVRWVTAPMRRS